MTISLSTASCSEIEVKSRSEIECADVDALFEQHQSWAGVCGEPWNELG